MKDAWLVSLETLALFPLAEVLPPKLAEVVVFDFYFFNSYFSLSFVSTSLISFVLHSNGNKPTNFSEEFPASCHQRYVSIIVCKGSCIGNRCTHTSWLCLAYLHLYVGKT